MGITVLWWPVDIDTPYVPYSHPFVLRNWDRLNREPQTVLGTDQAIPTSYYYGPLPNLPPGDICGTEDEWQNGLLYSTWIAGGYAGCTCPEVILPAFVSSVTSPLGTIVVSPHTGAVNIDVNPSYAFTWLASQAFNAGVLVDGSALPNYQVFEILGQPLGTPAAVFYADTNGRSHFFGQLSIDGSGYPSLPALQLAGAAGQFGLAISGVGTNPMTNDAVNVFQHGVGTTFRIMANGEICTNQTSPAGSGSLVAQLAVYDQTGTLVGYAPLGDTGAPSGGGGGIAIGDPVSGGTDGSVLYVDGSGNLGNDLAGNFFYDPSGSGPLGSPNTLYVGGANGNTNHGVLALWDFTLARWWTLIATSGSFSFGTGADFAGNLVVHGNVSCVGFTVQILAGGILEMDGQTSGAGSATGTLTNAPAAGNPAFWLPITINGTVYWVPAWA